MQEFSTEEKVENALTWLIFAVGAFSGIFWTYVLWWCV